MKPKLKRDWVGLKVKTLVELKNGLTRIPAGTICKVHENYGGLKLETDKCECCGVSIFITKIHEREVVIIGDRMELVK